MSTRSQVLIKDTGVYLYQHHDGYDLIDTVNKAIGRCERLDCVEFLTRIIFSEMIKDCIDESTGYGIGVQQHGDIEYLVTVDCKKRTVTEWNIREDCFTVITFDECQENKIKERYE